MADNLPKQEMAKTSTTKLITVDNAYKLAKEAFDSGNYKLAEKQCNKILEVVPNHTATQFLKGNAVGWQTTTQQLRFPEAVSCFANAVLSIINEQSVSSMLKAIESAINVMVFALVNVRFSRLHEFSMCYSDEADELISDLCEIDTAVKQFKCKTNRYLDPSQIYKSAIKTFSDDFRVIAEATIRCTYIDNGKSRDAFFQFERNIYDSVRILEQMCALCGNDNLLTEKMVYSETLLLDMILRENKKDYVAVRFGAYKLEPRLSAQEEMQIKERIALLQNRCK